MPFKKGEEIIFEVILDSTTGHKIEKPLFKVIDILGEGGFSIVYKVRNLRTGKYYALKTLKDEHLRSEELKRAFLDEIIMWLQLGRHTNIAHAEQRFTIEEQDFLLIEFIDGVTLKELLLEEAERRLSIWQVVDIGLQFCDAMIYCKEKIIGFVHRDIKPSNMMFTKKRTLKVIDFGLAECTGWQTVMSEKAVGTLPYMAPEILEGERATTESDIFSFGITLGVLLTGAPAVNIKINGENLLNQMDIPEELIEIFHNCVIKRKYNDFNELKNDFLNIKNLISEGKIKIPETKICSSCGYVPTKGVNNCLVCKGELVPWSIIPEFIKIPAGDFIKGCSKEMAIEIIKRCKLSQENVGKLQEYRYERISLSEFSIAKYPVTNREYYEFVKNTGYPRPLHWFPGDPPFPERFANHPVVNISFQDAEAYCEWMREKKGIPVRLPSPLEWEKAARGIDGRLYPWGNVFDKKRCHSFNVEEDSWENIRTSPVGEFYYGNSSPFDLEDMAGNVWEWIESYSPYKELRGGSWRYPGEISTLTFLSLISASPDYKEIDFGFRIVLEFRKGDPEEELLIKDYQFVFIPGAKEFYVGCPPNTEDYVMQKLLKYGYDALAYLERCRWRKVSIKPFYILKHPITNAQYYEFIKESSYTPPSHWLKGNEPFPQDRSKHPVSGVSWEDARAFCEWLSKKFKRKVRLPRAEEWEFAACGKSQKSLYPWGKDKFAPYYCNCAEYPFTVAVNSYPEGISPYGIFNMCGNVWEIVKDEKKLEIGLKGGSWKSDCELYGLSFLMMKIPEDYKENDMGFRLVKEEHHESELTQLFEKEE